MGIVVIGKVLAGGALAATTVVAGIGSTHSATTPTTGTDSTVACHRLLKAAPAELKNDLAAARKLPKGGDARHAALKGIRKDALHGDYGTKVQTFAEHRKELRKRARKALLEQAPEQLRQDLKAARKQPAEQRRAAIQKVRKSALDGTYGKPVQQLLEKRAENRKAHHQTCRAQRQERKAQRG